MVEGMRAESHDAAGALWGSEQTRALYPPWEGIARRLPVNQNPAMLVP